MKPLTWREIKTAVNELTEEQLDMSASILDLDVMEAQPVWETILVSECPTKIREELEDVLGLDQPVMTIGRLASE